MLKKKYRLLHNESFAEIFKKGRYCCSGPVSIKFLVSNEQKSTRIGFSIGKKYSPLATRRNYAKRVLREVMRDFLGEMKDGVDIVVMLSKKDTRESISAGMAECLKKGQLIKTLNKK